MSKPGLGGVMSGLGGQMILRGGCGGGDRHSSIDGVVDVVLGEQCESSGATLIVIVTGGGKRKNASTQVGYLRA